MELVLVPLGAVAVGILIAMFAEQAERRREDEPNEEQWPYVGKHRHIEGR